MSRKWWQAASASALMMAGTALAQTPSPAPPPAPSSASAGTPVSAEPAPPPAEAKPMPAAAGLVNPNAPQLIAPNFSSPRDSMAYFLRVMNNKVWNHGRIGPEVNLQAVRNASQIFDLQQVPESIQDSVGIESTLLLKEILDRLLVVDLSKLPDADDLAKQPNLKNWPLPGAPVIFTLTQTGPDAGEWQISGQTVERLPNYYEQIQTLPYLAGTGGGAGWDQYTRANVFPPWMMMERWGLRFWQWAGIVLGFFLEVLLGVLFYRGGRVVLHAVDRSEGKRFYHRLRRLVMPLTLLVVAVSSHFYVDGLRLLGTPLNTAQVIVFGIGIIGVIWLLGTSLSLLADVLVAVGESSSRAMDAQLIKLLFRAITVIVVVSLIIVGGNFLGLPAYSVVTGLGVGGLAMALGAKDTLANFMGSIMIMMDKPFRIGHWIRVGNAEGIVEEVGFRSTRIRTFDNSLVTIPNQTMTSQNIDNYGLRQVERILTTMALPYSTGSDKIEEFLTGVRAILAEEERIVDKRSTATVTDFGAKGIAIQLNVYIKVPSRMEEASERERLLMRILRHAEGMGLAFVPPG